MTINQRKEIEAKFYLGENISDKKHIESNLLKSGYIFIENRIETDYVPDTANDDCKKNNIIFRVREVTTINNQKMMLTIKTRKPSKDYIDYQEIETILPSANKQTFKRIKTIIKEATGVSISNSITDKTILNDVRTILVNQGFTKVRIYLDKYRKVYRLKDTVATIDYFPDGMGLFLEIEEFSAFKLNRAIKALKLDKSLIITEDYGDILKIHKKHLESDEQRKGKFSHEQITKLLNIP